jgi:choline dehydrogenase
MCHAQAFVRTSPDEPIPDVQVSMTAFAFEFGPNGRAVLLKRPSITITVCLARPEGRGSVSLRSARPEDPAVIRHRLLGSDGDVERIARGVEIAREILSQPAIAGSIELELRPGRDVTGAALRDYVRAASVPLYHPVGTCRMGSDPASVVDPDLRVRGVEGLWIADASVMPRLPIGNTNATAIMIGEKASDHIIKLIQ